MAELDLGNYRTNPLGNRLRRALWNICWLVFCRWTPRGVALFDHWRIFWLSLFGARIGRGSVVHGGARIWAPWDMEMGCRSCLSPAVFCYNVGKVVIGDNVVVSEGAWLCPGSHKVQSVTMDLTPGVTIIDDNA